MTKNFFIGAYWKDDFSDAQSYLSKSYKFLFDLKNTLKEYPELKIVTPNSNIIPLPNDQKLFSNEMLPLIKNEDAWYTRTSGQRENTISLDSTCDSGFFSEYLFENESDLFQVTIFGGMHKNISPEGKEYGNSIPNSIVISFPGERFNVEEKKELIKELMTKTIYHWNPYYASFSSHDFNEKIKLEETAFNLGWLTYFKKEIDPQIFQAKIKTEKLQNGFLLTFNNPKFDSNQPEDIDKGNFLKESLKKINLLYWPS